MRPLYVPITGAEAEALQRLATLERRTTRQQAAVLLAEAIRRQSERIEAEAKRGASSAETGR